MKIAILGAGGQLGRLLAKILPGDIVALPRAKADVTQSAKLRSLMTEIGPEVIINAAGFTHVDRAESERDQAFAVNAVGVRRLAEISRDLGATLIHFSTNYVFGQDVHRTAPYRETDSPGPINAYGDSKLAGEMFVQSFCPRHFILRTAGLYGSSSAPNQRLNFVESMLRQATCGKPIRVVNDQISTPTSVLDLAHAVGELIASDAYGLYHVTNGGACTWYEFAQAIFETTKTRATLVPITSDDYGATARRPRFSVLSNDRWQSAGFTPLPHWRTALGSYLSLHGT